MAQSYEGASSNALVPLPSTFWREQSVSDWLGEPLVEHEQDNKPAKIKKQSRRRFISSATKGEESIFLIIL